MTQFSFQDNVPVFNVCLPHSSQKNVQHTFLSHCDVRGVGKVNEPSHHLGANITQGDLRGVALFEAAGEHGSEVGATWGQYQPVHLRRKNKNKKTTTLHSPYACQWMKQPSSMKAQNWQNVG